VCTITQNVYFVLKWFNLDILNVFNRFIVLDLFCFITLIVTTMLKTPMPTTTVNIGCTHQFVIKSQGKTFKKKNVSLRNFLWFARLLNLQEYSETRKVSSGPSKTSPCRKFSLPREDRQLCSFYHWSRQKIWTRDWNFPWKQARCLYRWLWGFKR